MEIARGEAVEHELDSYITRADKRRREDAGERAREELWQASVRAHHERCQRELAWEWLRFHARQLRNHELTSRLIAAHHEQEIEKYERMLNINHEPKGAA